MKLVIDEDFFALKRKDFSEEDWRLIVNKWVDFEMRIRKELYDTGKISKITYNRFWRGGFRIFNCNRVDLILPSKFNEMFNIKPINIKYFENAINKIKLELELSKNGK